MKRYIIKSLSGLIIGITLLGFSNVANADVSPGWHKHSQIDSNRFSWEYVYSDGSFATGWQYIDGYWYYFNPESYSTEVGSITQTDKGYWVDIIGDESTNINGQEYYFDTEGRLLTNTTVYTGHGHFPHYIDNSGYISKDNN